LSRRRFSSAAATVGDAASPPSPPWSCGSRNSPISPATIGAFSSSRWRTFTTIFRGESTFPVMFAGHAAVQRPHSVHE
jgi:hypothetical protein